MPVAKRFALKLPKEKTTSDRDEARTLGVRQRQHRGAARRAQARVRSSCRGGAAPASRWSYSCGRGTKAWLGVAALISRGTDGSQDRYTGDPSARASARVLPTSTLISPASVATLRRVTAPRKVCAVTRPRTP